MGSELRHDGDGGDDGREAGRGLSRRALLRGGAAAGITVATGGILAACGGSGKSSNAATGAGSEAQAGGAAEGAARTGGRLRVGIIGGGASETLDFNQALAEMDTARALNLFEGLTDFDPDGKSYNVLAEELSPNADASVWTVKVRPDVEFHNGKKLSADDVIFSLKYMLDPKNKAQGAGSLTGLKPANIRRKDAMTVELRLDAPNAFLSDVLGDRAVKIFAEGTDFKQPVGTGPFKFQSWKRGDRSLFVKHDAYWDGAPNLDELELVSISDANARVNALRAKQIDGLSQADLTLVDSISGDPALALLEKVGGQYTALYVDSTAKPFTDNNVRQALRYMCDREQMVSNALRGKGKIGNDIPCWFDEFYAGGIEQRPHDPEKARALLKQAGLENAKFTLQTSDPAPAMLESSTLFVQQAKAAGLNVELRKWPTDQYYSRAFNHYPFAMTNWGGRPLSSQIALAYLKTSPYNETKWIDPDFEKLIKDAFATPDVAKRKLVMADAQQLLFDEGATVIWGFLPNIDAVSKKVHGITPSVIRSMGNYNFRKAWIEA
jgi:peptide/nickel transport system substrate-binding protein